GAAHDPLVRFSGPRLSGRRPPRAGSLCASGLLKAKRCRNTAPGHSRSLRLGRGAPVHVRLLKGAPQNELPPWCFLVSLLHTSPSACQYIQDAHQLASLSRRPGRLGPCPRPRRPASRPRSARPRFGRRNGSRGNRRPRPAREQSAS
ncbi:hypothetical protein DMC30DRAFT_449928, partial [Rhodotorula diobovata]